MIEGLASVEVINLVRRPERLAAFREEVTSVLGTAALDSIRVREAVDGLCLVPTAELEELFGGNWFGSRRATIACCLSHALVWADAAVADGPVLVFEDDVTLAPDFSVILRRVLVEVEERFPGWDLVLLGFGTNWDPPQEDGLRSAHHLSRIHWGGPLPPTASSAGNRYKGGTFGYLVSPGGATRLLELVEAHGFRHPVDICWLDWQDHLFVLEVTPRVVLSEYGPNTDIKCDESDLWLE